MDVRAVQERAMVTMALCTRRHPLMLMCLRSGMQSAAADRDTSSKKGAAVASRCSHRGRPRDDPVLYDMLCALYRSALCVALSLCLA
jgi:hypothetical protein